MDAHVEINGVTIITIYADSHSPYALFHHLTRLEHHLAAAYSLGLRLPPVDRDVTYHQQPTSVIR